ncbi:MAG: metal-dependent hydrolase [Coriobacteriia bacterium]|nr:metal-dependent hydrolase [Coriobacteriia bacterium]
MDARGHIAVGVLSAGVVIGAAHLSAGDVGQYGFFVGPAIAGVGALAPDIDHRDSWIGSRIPLTLIGAGLLLLFMPPVFALSAKSGGAMSGLWANMSQYNGSLVKWGALALGIGALLLTVSVLVTRAIGHRGATHSLAFAAGATVVTFAMAMIAGLGPWMGLMFGIGWVSHLMADAITPHGLPSLLWPLPAREEKGAMRWFGFLLIPFVALGMLGWFQGAGGGLFRGTESVTATSQQVVTGDVTLARQRLQEAAPEIEQALVNPDNPEVSMQGDRTTYTWQYIRQTDPASATVKIIAITLDGSGRLIGATGQ